MQSPGAVNHSASPTSECPDAARLVMLLDDQLDAEDRDAIEIHFGDCVRCQTELARLSTDTEAWPRLLDVLRRHDQPSVGVTTTNRHDQTISSRLQIPGFELLGELGRGGSGIIYRAHDKQLRRVVALKVLATLSPEHAIRFRNEAEAAARLQHPNIIEVFATGMHQDRMYLVMELVEGGDLASRLNNSPLPAAIAAELIETLARAIEQAHRSGILHRDLKPANILLQREGWRREAGGVRKEDARLEAAGLRKEAVSSILTPPASRLQPKITDFGLAYWTAAMGGPTHTGELIGTPGYMPPEQALASPGWATERVDIYALGAVLYECLTGRLPFQADSSAAIVDLVVRSEPVPPRRLNPRLPRDLETICLKCLEKQPSRRYATAEALADDLRRFLDGKPIAARPARFWERTAKWIRRRPAVAGLIAVFVIAVVTIAFVWIRFTQQLNEKTAEAIQKAREAEASLAALVDSNEATSEVLNFITTDVFDAAIPGNEGIDLTVIDALKRAEASIDERFAGRPKPEAAIRLAVGNVYYNLGQPLRAIDHLERAVELYDSFSDVTLREAEFDGRHAYLLCLKELGRVNEAQSQLAILQGDQWTPSLEKQLHLRSTATGFLMMRGQWPKAIAELEQLLLDCRASLGEDHLTTRNVFGNLAVAHFRSGDLDTAMGMWHEDFDRSKVALGRDDLHTLTAANNLAFGFVQQGKYADAETLHRETYELKRSALGDLHHETIGAKRSISMVVRNNRRQTQYLDGGLASGTFRGSHPIARRSRC